MKIISNFKDYYDYLQGKYGIDNRVVYERVMETQTSSLWVKTGVYRPSHLDFNSYYFYKIAFCGIMYCIWANNKKVYIGTEVEELRSSSVNADYKSSFARDKVYLQHHGKETNLNSRLKCPIVLAPCYYDDADNADGTKNIKLADFQFGKVVPPEDAYLRIVDFLTKEPVIKDSRTDVEKVVSHGFDKKTSFRNM